MRSWEPETTWLVSFCDTFFFLFAFFYRRSEENQSLPEMGKTSVWNKTAYQPFKKEGEVSILG